MSGYTKWFNGLSDEDRERRREYVRQVGKKWHADNKEAAAARRAARVTCPKCGADLAASSLSRHTKTVHAARTRRSAARGGAPPPAPAEPAEERID